MIDAPDFIPDAPAAPTRAAAPDFIPDEPSAPAAPVARASAQPAADFVPDEPAAPAFIPDEPTPSAPATSPLPAIGEFAQGFNVEAARMVPRAASTALDLAAAANPQTPVLQDAARTVAEGIRQAPAPVPLSSSVVPYAEQDMPQSGAGAAGAMLAGSVPMVAAGFAGGPAAASVVGGIQGASQTHEHVLQALRQKGYSEEAAQQIAAASGIGGGVVGVAGGAIAPGPLTSLPKTLGLAGAMGGGTSLADQGIVHAATGEPVSLKQAGLGAGLSVLTAGFFHGLFGVADSTKAIMRRYGIDPALAPNIDRLRQVHEAIAAGEHPADAINRVGATEEDAKVGVALRDTIKNANAGEGPQAPKPVDSRPLTELPAPADATPAPDFIPDQPPTQPKPPPPPSGGAAEPTPVKVTRAGDRNIKLGETPETTPPRQLPTLDEKIAQPGTSLEIDGETYTTPMTRYYFDRLPPHIQEVFAPPGSYREEQTKPAAQDVPPAGEGASPVAPQPSASTPAAAPDFIPDTTPPAETPAQRPTGTGETPAPPAPAQPGPAAAPTPVENPTTEVQPVARDYGTVEAPNRQALGEHFRDRLTGGATYKTINEARAEASQLLKGEVKPGTQAAKHVDEAVEIGVTHAARKIVADNPEPAQAFDALVDLYNRQPNLGVRTSTSIAQQAYSTPAPLAFAASKLAGINQSSYVYEPTAGNGMLLIGANPDKTLANELNPERAAALKAQGFEVTTNDAAEVVPKGKHDAIIANPPFGTIEGKTWDFGSFQTKQVDQAIAMQALRTMRDNGHAALILGAKANTDAPTIEKRKAYLGANRLFFKALYDNFNVTAHHTVNGDLYSKQGAKFPVDLIVIDGRGKATRQYPWQQAPDALNTWQDVKNAITSQPAAKPAGDLAVPGNAPSVDTADVPQPGSGSRPAAPERPAGSDVGSVPAPAERPTDVARPAGAKPAATPERPAGPRGIRPAGNQPEPPAGTGATGEPKPEQRPAPTRPEQPAVPAAGEGERPGSGGSGPGDEPTGLASAPAGERQPELKPPAPAEKPAEPAKPAKKKDAETEFQVEYKPASASNSLGTLVPKNLQTAVGDALSNVVERHGPVDQFVAKELGDDQLAEHYGAEQVDALAAAIANQKHGAGFILGDQTGVGKGRVVAGIIQYARKQGLVPVFVTEKPNLYGDIVRDLIDTGQSTDAAPFEPLVTNSLSGADAIPLPDGRMLRTKPNHQAHVEKAIDNLVNGGKLEAGGKEYHALFTTYAQLQMVTPKGQEIAQPTWRNHAIQRLAPHAYFILDESHNAGGTEQGGRGGGPDESIVQGRAGFIRQVIANAPGVLYSSATYAKRPSVMSLYSRTDMAKAVEGDVGALAGAIIRGGVPLQQIVAAQLAEAGQYIRRERSFAGVEFAPQTVDIGLHRADKVAELFRAIRAFDMLKGHGVDAVTSDVTGDAGTIATDTSTGSASVTSTSFSSILWNLVDQMLLTLKVDKAAEEAIAAHQRGEQVIIAVDSTMEAMLDRHIEATGTRAGDEISLDFRAGLQHYLERSREVTVKPPGARKGEGYRRRLTDAELGPEAVEAYEAAKKMITESGVDMPASPIDWLLAKLRKAGLKYGEITGRQRGIDYSDPEHPVLYDRPASEASIGGRVAAVAGYNSGDLHGLIVNQAGSTGLSAHAGPKFKNQNKRHMIILQAAKNIDTFMQMLGRINRTGQVVTPKYTLLLSNAPAETRPAAVLVKKMGSLNASVTADKAGAVNFDVPDIINAVGDEVIAHYLDDNPEVGMTLSDDEHTPIIPIDTDGNHAVQEGGAAKVTGRVALLPVAEQQAFWDEVIARYHARIEQLDAMDANPLVAKRLELDAKTLSVMPIFDGDKGDPSPFAGPAQIEKVDAKRIGKPMAPEEVEKQVGEFYVKAGETSPKEWARKQVEELRVATAKYANDVLAKMDDPMARERRREEIERQWGRVRVAMNTYKPGTPVNVHTDDADYEGVVIDFHKRGNAKNPAATGTWFARIALADAARQLDVPVSQMGRNVQISVHTGSLPSVLKEFTNAASTSREERYVATGNLLAAYGQIEKGSIITFTDNQGRTRQGVLLPKNFDPKALLDKQPVTFEKPDKAMSFLDRGFTLATPDEGMKVYKLRGSLVLETARSKAKGGRFFLNKKILAAADPDEFVTAGSKARLILDDTVPQQKVLRVVMNEFGLAAHEAKEDARAHLGLPSIDEQLRKNTKDKKDDEEGGRPPNRRRPTGFINVPAIFDAVEAAAGGAKEQGLAMFDELSGRSAPHITRASRAAGEAGVSYASARDAAPLIGRSLAAKVLGRHFGDPEFRDKLGAALTEDNLRSVKQGFQDQFEEARDRHKIIADLIHDKSGLDPHDADDRKLARSIDKEIKRLAALTDEDRDRFEAQANAVHSLIGAKDSPFLSETEYQDALYDTEILSAISRHKTIVMPYAEDLYRTAADIDPDMKLDERGLQTGARINLKVLFDDEEAAPSARVVGGGGGNLSNPLKRKSPFARQAKGTGERYDVNYENIVANSIGRQLETAMQKKWYDAMVKGGVAKIGKPGDTPPELGGKKTIGIPIQRRTLIVAKGGKTVTVPQNQVLFVREDLHNEARAILNTDMKARFPTLAAFSWLANKMALAGLTEAVYHTTSLGTVLMNAPALTTHPVGAKLAAVGGLPKLAVAITLASKKLYKLMHEDEGVRDTLAGLAIAGALRAGGKHKGLGRLIAAMDRSVRLVMNDAFDNLVRMGVPNTATNRREFINRAGQYNKRLQGPVLRWFRDTGLGPFATASATFTREAYRTVTFAPGVTAKNKAQAVRLRLRQLVALLGGLFLTPMLLNYLLTRKKKNGGVMGRPGTPIGAVDLGYDDNNGRPKILDVAAWFGIRRALRSTGLNAITEGTRQGKTAGQIADDASADIINAWLSPLAGPAVRALSTALTGYAPSVGGWRTAPTAEPGESQMKQKLIAAGEGFNPFVQSLFDAKRSPGTLGEKALDVIGRQFPRLTPTHGIRSDIASRTKAESLASEYLAAQAKGEDRTPDQLERSRLRRVYAEKLHEKDPNARKEIRDDKALTPADRNRITEMGHLTRLQHAIKQINDLDRAMKVFELATPEERKQIVAEVRSKIGNSETANGPKKQALARRVRELMGQATTQPSVK